MIFGCKRAESPSGTVRGFNTGCEEDIMQARKGGMAVRKINREELDRLVSQTGVRAREEAFRNGSYVVYQDQQGRIVREYADGRIVVKQTEKGGSIG